MNTTCIVAAKRTPFGRFGGALKKRSAVDLAVAASQPLIEGLAGLKIDQVIAGNVLSAGAGMNVARQIAVGLGLPVTTPAYTVNMVCGSGLHAVALAMQTIECGRAEVVLCGGTESMSNSPYLVRRSQRVPELGPKTLEDSILVDGLTDAFDGLHMATTAERLATKYLIDRETQDEFAAQSQARCAAAQNDGEFDAELVPVGELRMDEHPRPDTSRESLRSLRPAFDKNGTITAGNASGINDGAAMLLVANLATARRYGWPILAVVDDFVEVGCDPQAMGLGPVYAIRQLLKESEEAQPVLELTDFDRIEINEAFAAQVLACLKELGLDASHINRHGGAIALGHPIATSGARLVVHLAHQISEVKCQRALASLCVGGGQGVAMQLSGLA